MLDYLFKKLEESKDNIIREDGVPDAMEILLLSVSFEGYINCNDCNY